MTVAALLATGAAACGSAGDRSGRGGAPARGGAGGGTAGTSTGAGGGGGIAGSIGGSGGIASGGGSLGTAGGTGGSGAGGGNAGGVGVGGGAGNSGITVVGGQTISDESGTITLRIPPGALLGPTTFTFTPLTAVDNLPSGYTLVVAYRIDWSGFGFVPGRSVTVRIRDATAALAEEPETAAAQGDPLFIFIACQHGGILVFPRSPVPGEQNSIDLGCSFDSGAGGASGGGGQTTTAIAGLVMPSPGPDPDITKQPESTAFLTGDPMPALSITATGRAPLSYQWLRSGTEEIAGATSSTFTPVLDDVTNRNLLSVRVTNGAGKSITSDAVIVTRCDLVNAPQLPRIPIRSGSTPVSDLVLGPDNNVWFARPMPPLIGRVTSTGTVTEFLPARSPHTLAAGPDGNVWFNADEGPSSVSAIGRITPAGVFSGDFIIPSGAPGGRVTAGSDGNLWFTNGNRVMRVTSSGVFDWFLFPSDSSLSGIVEGFAGTFWVFDVGAWAIGSVDLSGSPNEIPLQIRPETSLQPSGRLAVGSDGNIWFAERRSTLTASLKPQIARVTPDNVVTEFTACGSAADNLVQGPDGNLWFTVRLLGDGPHGIGRITPGGTITMFPVASSMPSAISAGPDGSVWFADGDTLGRLR
jgi:streptogramin lyase